MTARPIFAAVAVLAMRGMVRAAFDGRPAMLVLWWGVAAFAAVAAVRGRR